jgi:protein SCO1/2
MRAQVIASFFATALLSITISCRSQESAGKRYELSGKVVAVDGQARRVTVAHDDIEGFMDGMTMPFTVKDTWALETLAPGDEIQATLVVTDEASWLEEVVISRKTSEEDAAASPPLVLPGEPTPGKAVPDFSLINQDGLPIHMAQYHGKALVLTFIYTRCPLPEYCPRMTSHFAALEKNLRDEPELYQKTHLLSVSFDHQYDSPEVLKEYAQRHVPVGPDKPDKNDSFEHWETATGSEEEIQAITAFFGLTYYPDRGQIVHSLRTAVVSPDGTLFKVYRGNEWTPSEILKDLRNMAP